MSCQNRMAIAIDALDLFIRSLPKDCSFSIISFGSDYYVEEIGGSGVITYTNEDKEAALNLLKDFRSDYGGTNILQPLSHAQSELGSGEKKKRIFLLTDGTVSDPQSVVQ